MRYALILLVAAVFSLPVTTLCMAQKEGEAVLQAWVKESLGAIKPHQLEQILSRAEVHVEKPASTPRLQPKGERIELTLDHSIMLALEHNLRLKIARLRRDAVQTEIPRAKAKFHPVLGLSFAGSGERVVNSDGSVSESNALDTGAFIQEEIPTGGRIVVSSNLFGQELTGPGARPRAFDNELLVRVVQPLLRGGWVVVATRQIQDARFNLRVQEARLRGDVLRVTADTKRAYYSMVRAEQIIAVTKEAIRRDKTLIEASGALFKAGLVTKRDVFSAEISLARDSARLVNAQADLESAKNNLLDVLGLPFDTDPVLLDKLVSFHPISLELDRWIETALEQRPEILEFEERLAQSWLNVRVEKNNVLPQVDLMAGYDRFQDNTDLGDAFDFSGEAWHAGLVFSMPLGNLAAKSALRRAKIEHESLLQQLVQTRRQIEKEVRDAVIGIRRNLENVKVFRVGIEQSKGLLEIARARFALGVATNLDITNAQEDLLQAETNLLSAIIDYNIGLAELEARIAAPF